MDRFSIIQFIIDIIKDRGHDDIFSITYLHDYIIVTLMLNHHSISKIIHINEVEMCRDPYQMVCSIINDMINQIKLGGSTND